MSSLLRNIKSSRGQSVVEFSFVAFFLFFLTMAVVVFAYLFYARSVVTFALHEAARYMVTGRTIEGFERKDVVRTRFCNNLIGTGLPCPADFGSTLQFACFDDAGASADCTDDLGGTGQIVVLKAQYNMTPFPSNLFAEFFPGGVFPINISTTWKNEPFS